MPVFILGEQTWPFFCCAKCRCSPYVIKDGLLEVKPFNHGSLDGGVWRVGAVKGYYFNGRQKNSQYIHVLKKKKKKVGICFHLKSQLERPFLRKIPEFYTCYLLSPLSPSSDFSRGHTQAGN